MIDPRPYAGAGLMGLAVAACFGLDAAGQWIFFAFGVTYGGLWMQHDGAKP